MMMWLSRTISLLVLMAGPALVGQLADVRLGTGPWLATLGIAVGMGLFIIVLSIYTRNFAPRSSPERPDGSSDKP
ncbi:MAG: hypothetical protein KatS3mg111_0832 [Pirellulaceae bacterium]|nr:MAG: hypothetical protein KatS3mg111_0832 [Pirellulaceae bacterium]